MIYKCQIEMNVDAETPDEAAKLGDAAIRRLYTQSLPIMYRVIGDRELPDYIVIEPSQRNLMTRLIGVLLLGLMIGCTYPGSGNGYDFGMAASPGWIVNAGNNYVCRYRTWGSSPDNFCAMPQLLACGFSSVQDGPTVAYDTGSDWFFYGALAHSGLCLSVASAVDPLVIIRSYFFTADQLGIPFEPDQPHITVTGNKVGVVMNGENTSGGQTHSITLVINKQDIIDNANLHTAIVTHNNIVTPAIVAGADNPVVFVWSKETAKLTVGIITGVPGHGDVSTSIHAVSLNGASTTGGVDPVPGGGTVFAGDHQFGGTLTAVLINGKLWTTTRVHNRKGQQLELDQLGTILPTFSPSIVRTAMVPLPPGGADFECESLGVTPVGNALVGFSTSGPTLNLTPYMVIWPKSGSFSGPFNVAGDGGFDTAGNYRLDFCPVGAQFVDVIRTGQWWAGIGVNAPVLGTANNSFLDGKESIYVRDEQF